MRRGSNMDKLLETLTNATDVNVFKNDVNQWSGLTRQCGNCIICNMYVVWKTVKSHALFHNVLIHCFSIIPEASDTDCYLRIWRNFKVMCYFSILSYLISHLIFCIIARLEHCWTSPDIERSALSITMLKLDIKKLTPARGSDENYQHIVLHGFQ